jgi:hypothetical protein
LEFVKDFIKVFVCRQVGVGHQAISWMWSCRAFGTVLSCFLTGFLFNLEAFKKGSRKIGCFVVGKLFVGLISLALPFITNYWILLTGQTKFFVN